MWKVPYGTIATEKKIFLHIPIGVISKGEEATPYHNPLMIW